MIGILLFAISLAVFACEEVNLTLPGGSMEKVPIQNQGNTALCYAYTAAQMVDAFRFSHGDTNYGSLTSPVALAIEGVDFEIELSPNAQLIEHRRKGNFNYGYSVYPLMAAQTFGSCTQSAIKEFLNSDHVRSQMAIKEHFAQMEGLAGQKLEEEDLVVSYLQDRYRHFELYRNEVKEESKEYCETVDLFSESVGAHSGYLKKLLAESSPLRLVKIVSSLICKGKRNPVPPFKVKNSDFMNIKNREGDVRETIDDWLESEESQPVQVGFCWNGTPDDCSKSHSALIVGRKLNGGQCQYLIRDTYGNNPEYWVNRDQFHKSVFNLSQLQEKSLPEKLIEALAK